MKQAFFVILLSFGSTLWGNCLDDPVAVPAPTEAAICFYKSGNIIWVIRTVWGLLLPALILFTGFSVKIKRFAQYLGKRPIWTFIIFVVIYAVLIGIVTFPLDYYTGFVRPHSYHISTQSFERWLQHFVINFWIQTVMSLGILGILYLLIHKSPRRWWLYMGLLMLPIQVFFQVLQPLYISPLFNKFGPMKDKQLEKKILALAERAGIQNSRVFEVDKSADTKMMNAYVTGFGNSKRIVLWDTIIQGMNDKELLFVMGHEMGHYVLNHIWWGILFESALAIFIMLLIFLASKIFTFFWSAKIGFKDIKTVASIPLILLLYGIFSLLLSPIENIFSRLEEHEADRFGLEITHSNRCAATAFLKLTKSNLGYPYPGKFYLLFRASHPSIGSRIEFFNSYKPWCEGKASKYQKYFKKKMQSSTNRNIEK